MTDDHHTANRDAAAKAAALWDEAHAEMEVLRRQLAESLAHQKAQAQLVDELRIELAQARTSIDTYRADAEQARADAIEIMERLKTVKIAVDSFELPIRRKLLLNQPPAAAGNGKADEPDLVELLEPSAEPSPELTELSKRIADLAKPPEG